MNYERIFGIYQQLFPIPSLQCDLTVYPNPANDMVSIKETYYASILEVKLYDVRGAELAVYSNSRNQINVSDLPAGLYLMLIHTEKEMIRRKVVIRH